MDASSANGGESAATIRVEPVVCGFDVTSTRAASEARLHELIQSNEGLLRRMQGVAEEREKARMQVRLNLLTDGYRVDGVITPVLHALGKTLRRALRLTLPLDVYVWPSLERNAFCLPSRKGNRLLMCLHAGILSALNPRELLFVMGHEVGHALFRHGETLGISFDDPNFSPVEVVRFRALERAQEISCDRVGLLACQDVAVASTALFKIASGLGDRWITFDPSAYARVFDRMWENSELVNLEDASRTHPFVPLRVKALLDLAKSDLYAGAFGRSDGTTPISEMEDSIEAMLSVICPAIPTGNVEQVANRFIIDGALMVVASDGVVDPLEVQWLQRLTGEEVSGERLAQHLAHPDYRQQLFQRLDNAVPVLVNHLSENQRAGLLRAMCDVACAAGGLPEAEFKAIDQIRCALQIRPQIATAVLQYSQKQAETAQSSAEPKPSGS